MEATLQALGGILLRAVPTFLLVLFLHFYLKKVFFQPLEKVLAERDAATTGARKRAEESLARADKLASEHEDAIRKARAEIYREQEEVRRQWRNEQAEAVKAAKKSAGEQVAAGKADLAGELEAARRSLQAESEALASQIALRILSRGAA
jgi:F-type H+-transporting ATPase subunit b